jgi:hypothetical protein
MERFCSKRVPWHLRLTGLCLMCGLASAAAAADVPPLGTSLTPPPIVEPALDHATPATQSGDARDAGLDAAPQQAAASAPPEPARDKNQMFLMLLMMRSTDGRNSFLALH